MSGKSSLPPEMLELVLIQLSNEDLLSCRSVSTAWNIISSRLCRNRWIGIKEFQNESNATGFSFSNFYSLFTKLSFWSRLDASLWKNEAVGNSWTTVDNTMSLLEKHGSLVKMINLQGDDSSTITSLFSLMPKIECISMKTSLGSQMEVKDLKLDRLKLSRVEITIDSMSGINFLQQLIQSSKFPLPSIKLSVSTKWFDQLGEDGILIITQLATVLKNIPTISFEYDSLQEITRGILQVFSNTLPPLHLTDLVLNFEDYAVEQEGEVLILIEKFLTHQAPQLLKLTIPEFYGIDEKSSPFDFPDFPKLEILEITMSVVAEGNPQPFNPIPAGIFNALETIIVKNAKFPAPLFDFYDNDDSELYRDEYDVFETVRKLVLHPPEYKVITGNKMRKWELAFPCLTRLEVSAICTCALRIIFSVMCTLTHLTAKLVSEFGSEDFNEALSGLRDTDSKWKMSSAEINLFRNEVNRPSLLSLKDLQFLSLTIPGLKDSGAMLSLMEIQPLYMLELFETQISIECQEKLANHHFILNVHRSASPKKNP